MSRLSKNILYNLIGQGLVLILGFIGVKFIFKQLGEDALGIIYFTTTLNVVLCSVLNKGIYTTTVREVSAHFNNEPRYVHEFIRTGALFCWSVYALFSIVVYFGAPFLVEKWINLKTIDSVTAVNILRILGIASLTAFPRSFYASLIYGLQRMEFNNIIDVVAGGLQQLGIVLILIFGGSIFHVVYWIAISYGFGIIAYISISGYFFSLSSLVPKYSYNIIKRVWEFASKTMSISFLAMVHDQADKVIISRFLPIGAFGYYGFAYGTISKAGLITKAIAQAALPSFSVLFKSGGRLSLVSQYKKLQDLICFITIPIFAIIPFAALPLFTYLFDEKIAKTLFLPIVFLTLGFYMNGTLNLPYQFSLAVKKPEIAVRFSTYALFIVLPITVLLIYIWGLTGAGLSWVFFNLFAYVYTIPRIYTECIEMPVCKWYLHIFRVYALAGFTYGSAWLFLEFFGTVSVLPLLVAYSVASVFFLIGAYFLISGELRETLFRYIAIIGDKIKLKINKL